MGSGRFPSEGFGATAFTSKIQYWGTSGTQFNATGLIRWVTNDSYYDLSLRSSTDSSWLSYFYFGGPGRVASSAPAASFTFSANPKAAQPVQFTDMSTGSPTSWSWNFGDGGTSTVQSPTHTFGTGTYQVSLTVSNSGGSNTITQAIVVVSGGGGNLSVNVSVSPNPATVNQTVTFSCNVSGGSSSYSYQWRSPAASTFVAGTSQTFSTVSSVPVSIQAGCTAFDSAGASNASAATVQVIAGAATCVDVNYAILDRDNGYASIPLSSGSFGQYFGVATGQNLVFQASGTGINSVDWTFGDGGTGSGNPKWYTYTMAGTFIATVTANSNAACSKSYIFQVAGPPEPPKWFVAGLVYTQGAAAGTVWQSDLTILNPHPTLSATYSLAFLDGKNPIAPKDLVWKTVTLGAQQSVSASNVVGSFFGKSLGSWGAVILRGDVAPAAPAITSRNLPHRRRHETASGGGSVFWLGRRSAFRRNMRTVVGPASPSSTATHRSLNPSIPATFESCRRPNGFGAVFSRQPTPSKPARILVRIDCVTLMREISPPGCPGEGRAG